MPEPESPPRSGEGAAGPILVSRTPVYVMEVLPRGRRKRRRLRPGAPKALWMWPGGTRAYRTRREALRAGR